MRSLIDDIDDLLNLGVGHTPRFEKIKKNIKAKKPLWEADVLYVKQLSDFYLHSKSASDESLESNKDLKINPKTNEDKPVEKLTSSKEESDKGENPDSPKDEKIILIVTSLALGLFFVFIIFSPPEENLTPNELVPSDSLPEDLSNTVIQNLDLEIISNFSSEDNTTSTEENFSDSPPVKFSSNTMVQSSNATKINLDNP